MNNQFEPLQEGEVISVDANAQLPLGHHTFRVCELTEAIKKQLEIATGSGSTGKEDLLSDRGVACEALRFGSTAWQKGRLRLCLEFLPDGSEHSQTQASNNLNTNNPGVANHTAANLGTVTTPPLGGNTNSIKLSTDGLTTPTVEREEVATNFTPPSEYSTPTPSTPPAPTQPEIKPLGVATAVVATTAAIASTTQVSTVTVTPSEENLKTPLGTNISAPMADAVLLTEEETTPVSHRPDLEEIAFEFHESDVNQGVVANNGSMDLDLTDTIVEDEYIDFESDGLPQPSDLQELFTQPENSGVLIDEVWNEMNQSNWSSIPS